MKTYIEREPVRSEVRHYGMRAPRYRWELYTEYEALPFKESREQYDSWDEACQAGKAALKRHLQS